jgi:selenocysteine-specific elongation factor
VTTDTPIRVIGTAGHVDHGKSSLIRALTGIDPDRLREERERGMTIDLGFAWLTLPAGADVGIVDVPGHQDFIRNMLAGVGGIDAVILVIAADEGIMPQTREHLAILELLGIERGVVALTKRDLVDDEWAALVRAEVRGALVATPLAAAPMVEVSATTRRGLDDLVVSLEQVLGEAPPRRDLARPRLPIDRAFTMVGFGTVVTGTLVDGTLRVGDEIELLPGGLRGRIRGLQTHRRAIDTARPGSRVAANLTGIEKEAIDRGMVLAHPGTLAPTSIIGTRLELLREASGPLEHDDEVRVHAGTAEAIARVSLLEPGPIEAGGRAWVQLRLSAPLAVAVGDRLVVRRPSPSETIGGGAVADISGERSRTRAETVASLERRTAPSTADRLLASFDVPRTAAEAGERSGLDAAARDSAYAALIESGRAIVLGDAAVSRTAFDALATRVVRTLAMAHRAAPLRAGLSREEVRSALDLPPKRYAALVSRLVADAQVAERGTALALPSHRPSLTPDQDAAWSRARVALEREPLQPPSVATLQRDFDLGGDVLMALADRGDIVRVGPDAVFLPDTVVRFGDVIIDALGTGPITVAKARDLTGSSRKHVLPLLQFLDDHGLTRRVGDDRVLIHDPHESQAQLRRAVHRAPAHKGETA